MYLVHFVTGTLLLFGTESLRQIVLPTDRIIRHTAVITERVTYLVGIYAQQQYVTNCLRALIVAATSILPVV